MENEKINIGTYKAKPKMVKRDIRKSGNEKKRIMNDIDIKEKMVIDLRRLGKSFRQIADELGYSGPGAVHNIYTRVMKRDYELLQEAAEAHRIEQMEILDEQLGKLFSQQRADPDNLQIVDRILKIMERKSKLIGLDMPTKIENKIDMSMNHESWIEELSKTVDNTLEVDYNSIINTK